MWPYSKRAPYYPFPLGGAVIMGSSSSGAAATPAGSSGNMPFGNSTVPAAISNVAVETAFALSAPIAPNLLAVVGSALWFEAYGSFGTTATPTIVARARLDNGATGDIIAQSPTVTLANNAAANPWFFRGGIEVRSSSLWASMAPVWHSATGVGAGLAATYIGGPSGSFAESSTIAHTIFLTMTFSAASPSNTISLFGFQVYAFNPAATA